MTTELIRITDFTFIPQGYGVYKVTYKSPSTGYEWSTTTTDMYLIYATRYADSPMTKDLNNLKFLCKLNKN